MIETIFLSIILGICISEIIIFTFVGSYFTIVNTIKQLQKEISSEEGK